MISPACKGLLCSGVLGLLVIAPGAFAQTADLSVTKLAPDTSAANTDVAFSISVLNVGPDPASSVTLSDPLPAGMTFVSMTQNTGPTFTCTTPAVGVGGTVTCSVASLTAGASADFSLTAHIAPGTPNGTTFVNIATVNTATFDPNSENDSSTAGVSTPPPPTADIGITKTGAGAAGPDTDVTYTIVVTNAGPDAATNATFTDVLPGTMTFVSVTQNGGPAMTCTTPAVGAGGTVTCQAATFPAGGSATFTLVGHVPAATGAGTSFTNTATVSASTFDPNSENDAQTTTFFVSQVDLAVTKSGPPTSTAGSTVAYTIVVSNAGPDIAQSVVVSDVLPPPTRFVSLTQDTGPAASCTTPPVDSNGTVSCSFPLLGIGAAAQFTLTLDTANAVTIVNTATVASESFDTNPSNNAASTTSAVTQIADVSVTKSATPNIGGAGHATYTLTVANAGPSNAANATLSDVLPAQMAFVSLQQTDGPPFTCTTPAVGAGGAVSCTIASLQASASATFALVARLANPDSVSQGTVITNTATIATTTSDSNSGNNSASADTTNLVAPPVAAIPAIEPLLLALLSLMLAGLGLTRLRTR